MKLIELIEKEELLLDCERLSDINNKRKLIEDIDRLKHNFIEENFLDWETMTIVCKLVEEIKDIIQESDNIKRYIIDYSLKNGLGHPAISIYLTGCDNPIKCEDCHNWELQEQSKNDYNISEIKHELDKEIQGYLQFHNDLYIVILGGEPLAEYNKDIVLEISQYLKQKYKDATIVIYSWRTIEQINKEKLELYIKHIDYGVLGSYNKDLYVSDTLPSSINQYIYDFKNNKKLEPIKLKRGRC